MACHFIEELPAVISYANGRMLKAVLVEKRTYGRPVRGDLPVFQSEKPGRAA